MEYNLQHVNLGRALTHLSNEHLFSLEEKVFKSGTIPGASLQEKASVARGIVEGLLEVGNWPVAVRHMYEPGPVKMLLEDYLPGFRENLLATAKKRKAEHHIDETAIQTLAEVKEFELLYQFVIQVPMPLNNAQHLFHLLTRAISPEQNRMIQEALAVRAVAERKFIEAIGYWENTQNEAALDKLYDTLLHDEKADVSALLDLACRQPKRKQERVRDVVLKIMDNQKLLTGLGWDGNSAFYGRLCDITQDQELTLSDRVREKFLDLAVTYLRHDEIKKRNHPALSLHWAKIHADKDPWKAYEVFKAVQYAGPERFQAAAKLVSLAVKNQHNLDDRIDAEDLQKVYFSVNQAARIAIALRLADTQKLQELSKEVRGKNDEYAYRLWVAGSGNLEDPYVINLRHDLVEEAKRKGHSVYASFVDPRDEPGQRQVFDLVLEHFPKAAYELAQGLKDDALVEKARQQMIQRSPEWALSVFSDSSIHERQGHDSAGIELAVLALTQKYEIPREMIAPYLPQQKVR